MQVPAPPAGFAQQGPPKSPHLAHVPPLHLVSGAVQTPPPVLVVQQGRPTPPQVPHEPLLRRALRRQRAMRLVRQWLHGWRHLLREFGQWLRLVGVLAVGPGPARTVWKDNRVDYFFAHLDEVVDAHIAGLFFGAGAGGMTTPETDGGNLVAKTTAYRAAGGVKLCP